MAKKLNKAALARRYGVSLPAVDGWIRRGCPHTRTKNGEFAFDLALVGPWRAQRLAEESIANVGGRSSANGRRSIAPEASRLLTGLMLPEGYYMPWCHDQVVSYREYGESTGLDDAELFTLLLFGLPILPPEPGTAVGARVSIPHADRWRAMFAIYVEGLGGDGYSATLGAEAMRLRGLPPIGSGEAAT
jgi:hypothetical protein